MPKQKNKKTAKAKQQVKKQVKKPLPKKQKAAVKKKTVTKVKKQVAPKKAQKPLKKQQTKQLKSKPAPKASAKKPLNKASRKIVKKQVEAKKSLNKASAKTKTAVKATVKETKAVKKEQKLAKETKKSDSKKAEVAVKKAELQKNTTSKKTTETRVKSNFKVGEYAVYPSHGVGKIVDVEKTIILGQEFSCYIMYFEKEKLNIKIPTSSVEKIGLRHLASKAQMDEVFSILRSGIKKLKGMWSRRAQEYETKINSGDIILLAEVLRDLTRDIEDGDRSYSERIIYETAVNRLASEYSVVYNCDFEDAKAKVVATAKDKLGVEGKIVQKDEFDEFDYDEEDSERDEDEEDEDDEDDEEGDEDDDMYDDEDDEDEKPRKRRAKG